ncbi:MAG TPA: ABC-2 family transporter protein, partial [Gaiellaceae bacterium]
MTTLRVALLHLRVGVMNDLQYRVNFALQVLQSILAVAVGLIVFQLVFSHTQELNGWTHSELLAILGVQSVMAGVVHAVIQPNMMRLSEEVQDGKLDHALTKPVD